MAAQKQKREMLTLSISECLLNQNPANQDSQLSWFFQNIGKAIRKSKLRDLWGIISVWK